MKPFAQWPGIKMAMRLPSGDQATSHQGHQRKIPSNLARASPVCFDHVQFKFIGNHVKRRSIRRPRKWIVTQLQNLLQVCRRDVPCRCLAVHRSSQRQETVRPATTPESLGLICQLPSAATRSTGSSSRDRYVSPFPGNDISRYATYFPSGDHTGGKGAAMLGLRQPPHIRPVCRHR